MYVLPIDPKISWEGHLSGLVSGAGLAFFIKKGIVKPKLYTWQSETYDPEEDEFLRHFDEDGNFIESIPEDFPEVNITITYDYKDKNSDQEENYKDDHL